MKKRIWVLLALLLPVLCSCRLLDQLGFDTYDYMGEKIQRTLEADGPEAERLEALLSMLNCIKKIRARSGFAFAFGGFGILMAVVAVLCYLKI